MHATVIDKVILMCARDRADEVHGYLSHVLARGSDLAPVRSAIEAACLPEFAALIMDALPWLGEERFRPREPAAPETPAEVRLVRAMIDAARGQGLPASDFDAAEIEALGDEVIIFAQHGARGRPRKMVRLREHDPRFNPFALAV